MHRSRLSGGRRVRGRRVVINDGRARRERAQNGNRGETQEELFFHIVEACWLLVFHRSFEAQQSSACIERPFGGGVTLR